MRIFLDANILFSASLPQSRMKELLDFLQEHAILLTNSYAREEAVRNLKIKFPEAMVQCNSLLKKCEIVRASSGALDVVLAQKDVPILLGAIEGKATHLLTGDERDFGVLWGTTIQGVAIVSPKMLVEELKNKKLL